MFRRALLSALPAGLLASAAAAETLSQRGSLRPTPAVTPAAPATPATIGIMGGEIDGTFMRIATDLTSVINSDALRVIPIIGKGSLQNIGDLLNLKGVDLALVASDALAYARIRNLYPGQLDRVQYICKLYDNDMHICAGPEIQTVRDLQGKPVNIDVLGAGTNLTARVLFQDLGIQPILQNEEPGIGMTKLMRGEIAANLYSGGKPIKLFQDVPVGTNLHFLSVPENAAIARQYLPAGELTHTDYPNLIPVGQSIPTIGIGVVLAVYDWPSDSQRYHNLVTFVHEFFTRFPELLKPPHHPKWRDVNLAAEQPGWVRFQPAADWLAQHAGQARQAARQPLVDKFSEWLQQNGATDLTPAQKQQLLQSFQQVVRAP